MQRRHLGAIVPALLVLVAGLTACRDETAPADSPRPLHSNLHADMTAYYAALDALPASGPRLVFIGDSITDRMHHAELWPDSGGRVLSRAIAGETVAGAHVRLEASLPRQTRVVVLMLGVNDLLQGADPARVADGLEDLVRLVLRQDVPHVVVESLLPTTRVPGAGIETVNDRLRDLADRTPGVEYLDLHGAFLANDSAIGVLLSDGVHLTPRGALLRHRIEREFLTSRAADLGLTGMFRSDAQNERETATPHAVQ